MFILLERNISSRVFVFYAASPEQQIDLFGKLNMPVTDVNSKVRRFMAENSQNIKKIIDL